MFAVWEYEGGHLAIGYIFKRSKRCGLSGIVGKAIPQMGPTVADTSWFVREGIRVITQKVEFWT